jgi:hypothetical protein
MAAQSEGVLDDLLAECAADVEGVVMCVKRVFQIKKTIEFQRQA